MTPRVTSLLKKVKEFVSDPDDLDSGAVIQAVKKCKKGCYRVYYSKVGNMVNSTPREQLGMLSIKFLSMDHLYFHHSIDDNYSEQILRCDVGCSVRMFGANESVDEENLALFPKADYFPFVDQKLPFDFYDPDKGCVIVSYICSLPSYVLKDLEEEDIVAFLDNADFSI